MHHLPDTQDPQATTTIEFRGKKYRIFRPKPNGNWAIRVRHSSLNPNAAIKRLGTSVQNVAIKNAKLYLERLLSNDWAALNALKSRSSAPTIGEIIDEYRRACSELELQSVTINGGINALLRVICLARQCDKEKAKETLVTLLNSDLIAAYWKATGTENRNTAASRLNQAQAIFSTRAMEIYRRKWRQLPDLTAFSSAPKLRRRSVDQTFKDSGADVAGQMEWAAQQIRQTDPDTYRVYLLAARLGLRDKEIVHVRGNWIEERRGKWVLAVIDRPKQSFQTKAGVNRWLELSQELIDEFCEDIGKPQYLIADGKPPTTRQNAVYRTASAFIRRYLPARSKSLHELRKYAGARIATEHGLYAAKEFLGHTTVSTTEKHYAAYLKTVCAVSAVPIVVPVG